MILVTVLFSLQNNATFHPVSTTSYGITLEMQYVIVSISGFILFVISIVVLRCVFCHMTEPSASSNKPIPSFHIDIDIRGPKPLPDQRYIPFVKEAPRKIQPMPLAWLDEDYTAVVPPPCSRIKEEKEKQKKSMFLEKKTGRSSVLSQLFLSVSDKSSVLESQESVLESQESVMDSHNEDFLYPGYKDTAERLQYYTHPQTHTLLSNPSPRKQTHPL